MILIITGPSGVGKNTIIDALSKKLDFNFSVSHTTRPKRVSEVNGKDYYFISSEEFQNMINNNELVEFEEYGGFAYGTSRKELNQDGLVILDLEVNGATKLLNNNNDFIGLFIDIDDKELINRLKNRGHNSEFINKRMELASKQRKYKDMYHYKIENVDINTSVNEIIDIIYKLEER
tara:strand:- start:10903 stop:11433 length:531 start_codon:yes stop_codon:yes gene_type:complete